jgi:plasmid stabilization system protein ParE
MSGRIRPELSQSPLRFWVVPRHPNYIIVYDPETKPLMIIRILHGKRNLKRILAP